MGPRNNLPILIAHFPCVVISGARQDPELFLNNHHTPLVLDEIQFAPELVPSIKRRIDQNRSPGQFILTGSQQWQILKNISESLSGRAVFIDLDGFCLKEIADAAPDNPSWLERWLDNPEQFIANRKNESRLSLPHGVFETLWRGSLPEAVRLNTELVPTFYSAYNQTYIERDVRLIADVTDWQQFGRFLALASALTAQEINYSEFGRDIGITPQTAQRWLSTLKATFQWVEISAFSMSTTKRISKKPKGYLSNTGLAAYLQAISSPHVLPTHPLWGAMFETAVVTEIMKLANLLPLKPKFTHCPRASHCPLRCHYAPIGKRYRITLGPKLGKGSRISDSC